MPILEQGATAEPRDGALLRLAELTTAIDAAAELLTPTDARAIRRELDAVARAFGHAGYPKRSHRPANAARTVTPTVVVNPFRTLR